MSSAGTGWTGEADGVRRRRAIGCGTIVSWGKGSAVNALRNILSLGLLAGLLLGVAGCDDTIRGIGKDIKETGRAIEDAVR